MRPRQARYQAALRPDMNALLILKHFPIFCPLLLMVSWPRPCTYRHLFLQIAYWTVTVHIPSAVTGAISPARRLSFSRASHFICNFI